MYISFVEFRNGETQFVGQSDDLATLEAYADQAAKWWADYGGVVTILKQEVEA